MRPVRRPPLAELQPYLLAVPHPRSAPDALQPPSERLIWQHIFGNDGPVEIEVGSGKGLFLLTQAQARPGTNFLGIEIERKYALLTASRLARRQFTNVRLACTDARWLLRECVPTGTVAAVHVYFPDPWWKQRHRKRRVFTPEFAAQLARVLAPRGQLHFVSDVRAYFDETTRMLADGGWVCPSTLLEPADYLTNFERKYRLEGRPIYRALFERASVAGI